MEFQWHSSIKLMFYLLVPLYLNKTEKEEILGQCKICRNLIIYYCYNLLKNTDLNIFEHVLGKCTRVQ